MVASVSDSTGATQASVPANTAVHSSRVRVAKASAMRRRSAGQVAGSVRTASSGAMPSRSVSSS